ncbi:hypothetical protein VSS37_03325 [Candidatus Thiothrix sp. Deng01]|uniref:Uncharacterized protein n=1 Tax=Candidatus Thiothrix phosphatis TaxID=3112415 RepID=A0ABU6CTT7_9GAMM|nr:hypothetical protein [Candidatus Thiothrix sp. Deng01]MEB4590001.1 hypothetical protein [Candidatus Thiothrix sp. Deng01]
MINSNVHDEMDAPSFWMNPKAFSESTFEKLDEMYFDGDLDGMDAGDVFSVAVEIEAEQE